MEKIMQYVYMIIVILVSLTFHEVAHGYVSYRLGDPTAKNQGRLTLNPIRHLDSIGTIMMAASLIYGAGFGWAKPVPINPNYYKNNKSGTMLTSVAGPAANLLLAFVAAFPVAYISIKYYNNYPSALDYRMIILNLFYMFLYANINLAIFNLIPMPPLDGSKILAGILPDRIYFRLMEYERYGGIIFLIILLAFPGQFSTVLNAVSKPISQFMLNAAEPVVRLFI
ncbi:MAG: site-2 protease family protein [Clostridiales bacterium]|nr:site-2 protease family protein [Clostridiales bacterium]